MIKARFFIATLTGGFLSAFAAGLLYAAYYISVHRYLSYRMYRLAAAVVQTRTVCWVIGVTVPLAAALFAALAVWRLTVLKRKLVPAVAGSLVFLLSAGWLVNRFCLPGRYHPLSLIGDGLIVIFSCILFFRLRCLEAPSGGRARWPRRTAVFALAAFLIINGLIYFDRRFNIPAGPNLIILMADALRKDHLGIYGYPRETTPVLDRFAAKNHHYPNVTAASSWTNPSIASFFTSLYVSTHGCLSYMDDENNRLDPALVTLAEGLREKNYSTGAFVANHLLKESLYFNQGFEVYDGISDDYKPPAAAVNRKALEWIRSRRGRPFFAYLHYMDVHGPYRAPGEYSRLFRSKEKRPLNADERAMLRSYITPEADNDLNYYINQYDGLIRYLDTEIGKLLAALFREGLLENSIVIFLSDHGEAFFEHGFCTHGRSLYDEEIEVPLIVSLPEDFAWPLRPETELNLIDLSAAIFEGLGLPVPYPLDGITAPAGIPAAEIRRSFPKNTPIPAWSALPRSPGLNPGLRPSTAPAGRR